MFSKRSDIVIIWNPVVENDIAGLCSKLGLSKNLLTIFNLRMAGNYRKVMSFFTNGMEYVTYDEFKKLDMRVGTIRAVEPVLGTDKLLKCQIDFGETEILKEEIGEETAGTETPAGVSVPVPKFRQIVSGIREFFPEYEKLVGKQVLYIVNLEPRMIRGVESQGMLMAVDGKDGKPVFLTPEFEVHPGSRVR